MDNVQPIKAKLESLRSQMTSEVYGFCLFLVEQNLQLLQITLQQATQIKALEDQQKKNSRNSSKPPSSDGLNKPQPKSLRKPSEQKPGGQNGHEGNFLQFSLTPDHIVPHPVCQCRHCLADLTQTSAHAEQKRQVWDIPPMKMEVWEHWAEIKNCPYCGETNVGAFPTDVDYRIQYGPNVKALGTYLLDYQMISYDRAQEFIYDLSGHTLSQGTLHNAERKAFETLEDFEMNLVTALTLALVAGFDETGLRVVGKLMWLHVCCTEKYACYFLHEKRGDEAMNAFGILPDFQGRAIHDYWKSYYLYHCLHGLCNAHILRELIFINERFGQSWAADLITHLIRIKEAIEQAKKQGLDALSAAQLADFEKTYHQIVKVGLDANPPKPPPPEKKRGRTKQSKPFNLLNRLDTKHLDILAFMYDFNVPFDNNMAERDLRMVKVKQKISGCFRSVDGARYFARIRSYIVTARKQGFTALEALKDIFSPNPLIPALLSKHY